MSTLLRQTRAEVLKLATLRPTWIILAVGLAAGLLLAYVQTTHTAALWQAHPDDRTDLHLATATFNGLMLTQISLAALGASIHTSETSTGTLTGTLLTCPRRTSVFLAKTFTATLVGLACASAAVALHTGLELAVIRQHNIPLEHSLLHATPTFVGYLLSATLLGLGMGLATRNLATSVAAAVLLQFLLPILLRGGDGLQQHLANLMPGTTLMDLIHQDPAGNPLASLILIPAVLLLWGGARFARRDA